MFSSLEELLSPIQTDSIDFFLTIHPLTMKIYLLRVNEIKKNESEKKKKKKKKKNARWIR